MKISLSREELVASAQLVGRAVSTRTSLPSLAGIQMTAQAGTLVLRATDMEMSLTRTSTDVTVEQEGVVLLPARLFGDVSRSLPDGTVTLEHRAAERDVEVRAGGAAFHLKTLPADDFPTLPAVEEAPATLPAATLAEMIERVARAASRDEVRPVLTGVLFTASGRTLTMVATDSYRLSVKHSELDEDVAFEVEANVPAKALRELARIIAQEGSEQVEIALSRNQAVFTAGPVTLASRLIEGQFPSWRQLIPDTFEHEVKLPRAELLDITRRIANLAQRNVPIRLAFAEGELTVAAETPEVGDAAEAMPAPYTGEPLEIAFNPQFFVEGVESIDEDELVVRLSSPLRPGLLQPAGREDFSYLVMPIRLNV